MDLMTVKKKEFKIQNPKIQRATKKSIEKRGKDSGKVQTSKKP